MIAALFLSVLTGADNGGPDILQMALITMAASLGAGALATVLFLVRKAMGFDPHRPSEGEEGGGGEH